jgi:hypothetical protein
MSAFCFGLTLHAKTTSALIAMDTKVSIIDSDSYIRVSASPLTMIDDFTPLPTLFVSISIESIEACKSLASLFTK